MANIFIENKYNTPHDSIPFSRIRFEEYEEAMTEGMKQEDAEIERVVSNPDKPTFDNTMLTRSERLLSRTTSVFFNLLSACRTDKMEALSQKMQPLLSEHASRIAMNTRLFERIKGVRDDPGRQLTPEEQKLLDDAYEGFTRSGALLPEEEKKILAEKRRELGMLTLQFSQNELHATNAFSLHLTTEEEVSGLPESALEAAAMEAKSRGLEGWVVTLKGPSYSAFLQYADRRDLREKVYRAMATLCTSGEWNNLDIVRQIVNLRREIAEMLGFKCYADFALKERMAQDTEHVDALVEQLLEAYMPKAREEVKEIEDFAREEMKAGGREFKLEPWDLSYYSHKLRKARYDLDSEMLRPYFPLDRVKESVFSLATRLYGITFTENPDIEVYHPDVKAYEVRDADGTFLAVLYADFFPRDNKQSGAWMTSYREQWIDLETGKDIRPLVSIVLNVTKPTETKPALLTLGEVETFLHEFGHALHGIFSKVRFEGLSCTNVYWDFVELPSQFMENFVMEPEFLRSLGRHFQTGEPLPEELIERIMKAKNFMVAYGCIRQVAFILLDMAYYTLQEPLGEDIMAFETKAWSRALLFPQLPGSCMSTRFGHIMSGGYAAGYYSYKWAEVLDADAFSVFQKEGIFNPETAKRFRDCILSRGGTEHPMTLYKRFRGGEPTIEALLRRNGITTTSEKQPKTNG
ncbi:MAG: M3 family metallopeptidase [Bacteroidaceae bacterium]|nr:M3 family metallopeptidase [Bacteroidaceae bacterium]MBR6819890.1 M3 family metallopeptidase [Bacteroidaceae bacterium]MBR7051429.1 M3 family metallopeptidase [Bacteroidaceae bacterium]